MRPVRLELNGFAGFRVATVVDFTDADYFALVGSTGSGKSTILDALTFALYGTAYRWGRSNAISYALAPTSNRCTVSLTFDVASQRYQVAREVRRIGGQVQQKAVSLVRFADPTAGAIDPNGPQPEVLAGEIKELNAAVEQLLGLSFDDFCQCVVLPQGDFARFLSANTADRQRILLKLLGAAHYEGIGKRAGVQRDAAAKEVEVLTEQLGRYADATPEAEAEARARVSALELLATSVDALVPGVDEAHARAAEAAARAQALGGQADLLASISAPHGVEELQRAADDAQRAVEKAREAEAEAGRALADAHAAGRAAPERAAIEHTRDLHLERADLAARRERVFAAADRADWELARHQEQLHVRAAAVDAARADVAEARARLDRAHQAHDEVRRRRDRLARVRTPEGLSVLADRVAELARQADDAERRLTEASDRHERAATALAADGDGSRLTEARGALDQLDEVTTDFAAATSELGDAIEAAARTDAAVSDAQFLLDARTGALEEARTLAGAGRLRPVLRAGHACPVCEQTVTAVPPPLPDPALDAAKAGAAAATREHREALSRHQEATATVTGRQRTVDALTVRRTMIEQQVAALLPELPEGAAGEAEAFPGVVSGSGPDRGSGPERARLDGLVAARNRLIATEEQTRAAAGEARTVHGTTLTAAGALRRELDRARTVLDTQLGALTDLEPPTADPADPEGSEDLGAPGDLTAAWARLDAWARAGTAEAEADLAVAATAVATADEAHQDAVAALETADREHEEGRVAHTRTVRDATAAEAGRTALTARLRELDALLSAAPSAEAVPGLLAERTRLDDAVTAAAVRADRTREALGEALAEQQRTLAGTDAARSELTAARDTVAALAPPRPDTADLAAAWADLVDWAAREAAGRRAEALGRRAEARAATDDADELLDRLDAQLSDHGLDPGHLGEGPGRAAHAPRVVAIAVERARAEAERIVRDLAEAASVRERADTARTRQQVATELARLMRSERFPRWLAESALDTLVEGASESLRQLSGARFDLSHRKGEFYVVDHADADTERSVRTLSGGETFQASLALALALSEQLAGLGSATKLESIFLDEGFGTLDPESLDTVADTLETLAQGDRMVGLITHVPGLAERVPVRFRVRRDAHSSVVTREGA
ncbi:SMC family ATPase [Streptomyces sp. NBC_01278]|uniref:SMC family ATPase n=1 Tax=Streptomyces sp. NBC_01278 TaxID=2903809 RepID=UPI002E3459A9|nr:SMC family ATPase [Streptomyces sp. NBC_01278]